ncbi:MAG TPA: tetratricopeptide repeat protein [Elusimicrobiota bacterium]|jgi:tetratricopeptide (TPR) repeat protein|nr:tetratricopeptide repeat protein [Elusimicrobiota bacterium]
MRGPVEGACLAAALAAAAVALPRTPHPFPPPSQLRLVPEEAVASASLVSLGMHRLAADLAFIRLVVYYGSPDRDAREQAEHPEEGPHDHAGGVYRDIGPRALRVLSLDPYFEYPVLYAAGALAFNLHRPDEALSLLAEALRYEPRNWKYLSYVGAVGFAKKGDPERALAELAGVLASPDCPTMLRSIAAFMCVRMGRREQAIKLYRQILESRDEGYHPNARRMLERLGAPAGR